MFPNGMAKEELYFKKVIKMMDHLEDLLSICNVYDRGDKPFEDIKGIIGSLGQPWKTFMFQQCIF